MTPPAICLPKRPAPQLTQWLDTECADLVQGFWNAAGAEEPFPRTLEVALGFALPVTLVRYPALHTDAARNWLRSRNRDLVITEPSRPLHGCLVAYQGNGIIFLDASDSPDEQRFSLAHEIAHFLVDYTLPRRRAIAVLGPSFADVLDGKRSANTAERLASLFTGLTTQPHVNLMQRTVAGGDALTVWAVEHRADRVALALLAPPDIVVTLAQGHSLQERRASATQALVRDFGLPPVPAQRYAAELIPPLQGADSWVDGLRARIRAHSAEASEEK